ncbi:hypothetical protein WJX75_008635 [Coccomyxa subellipsoidea]|uniref:HMG box domain-containing protein n=1 Tax=Coccomyxa subellipsoidea TaxID=248742 RepID=A0ABR2Z1G6_9CHLO
MAEELTDSQLMAELQEFEDAQAPYQGEPAINEKEKEQGEQVQPQTTPESGPASTADNAASAGASTEAAKEKSSPSQQLPVIPAKKRGAAGQQKKDADDSNPKVKRARSAYIFFGSEKRPAVKAENPDLSFGDLTKKLGEMWKGLSDAEKMPYEAMANEDKDRAGAERAEAKAEKKSKPATDKKKDSPPAKAKQPRAKSAYQLFCDDQRQNIKEDNPDAGFGAINSKLAAAWKEVSEEDKAKYNKQNEELKAKLPAATKVVSQDAADESMEQSKEKAVKRKAPSTAQDDAAGATPAEPSTSQHPAADDEGHLTEIADDSVEKELMDVDWQAHPAETIVAEAYHAKYLVKRKGLDFSACGLVDAKAAKRQRLMAPTDDNQTESAACPVTVPMMDEWDAFNRSFRCAVHAHSDSGELNLDDLNQESPLEMCHWLGIMREPDFPLSKAVKNKDVMIKVPMLEVSKAVQRVAAVERKAAQEARAAAEAEKQQRMKAEEDLAAQQQETLQLRALLKEHNIAFDKGGQAAVAEE